MEIFEKLNDVAQRQLVAVSLETQAAMLKTQAEELDKLAERWDNVERAERRSTSVRSCAGGCRAEVLRASIASGFL